MTLNHSKTWPITTTMALVQLRVNPNGRTYSTLTDQHKRNFLTDPKKESVSPDENYTLSLFNNQNIQDRNSIIVQEKHNVTKQNQVCTETNFEIPTIDLSNINVVNNNDRSYEIYENKVVSSVNDERYINPDSNEINPDFNEINEISRNFNERQNDLYEIHRDLHEIRHEINRDSNKTSAVTNEINYDYNSTNQVFNETNRNYKETVCYVDKFESDIDKTCLENVEDAILFPLSKRHVEMFTKMSYHPTRQTIRTDTVSTILEQDSEHDYDKFEAIGECFSQY